MFTYGNIIQAEQVMLRNINVYVCAYMHVGMINERECHGFGEEQGEGNGRVWRREWEGLEKEMLQLYYNPQN